ncbi:hypothetical protein [Novosphingobium sp.]|uniref:hypothetical protein n=1 Tax=Novosphingobium sp. TaxID=1874826 RepID=UPI002633B00C|nr:hypothetical protein [Novosphingobium sp.]
MPLRPPASVLLSLGLPLALAGCSGAQTGTTPYRADRVPPARVTGPAESCIPLMQFRETQVRDSRTIDFLAPGGRRGWRSTLPNSCPGLTLERAFSFNTSISQLCQQDIITVLQRLGPGLMPGAACGLGPFTPIELERRR